MPAARCRCIVADAADANVCCGRATRIWDRRAPAPARAAAMPAIVVAGAVPASQDDDVLVPVDLAVPIDTMMTIHQSPLDRHGPRR